MSITVHNKKTLSVAGASGIYIGRPHPLGNPFRIGEDGTRDEVIRAYGEWLDNELNRNGMGLVACNFRALKMQYINTGQLDLICWCAPEPCHGDIIRDLILDMTKDRVA